MILSPCFYPRQDPTRKKSSRATLLLMGTPWKKITCREKVLQKQGEGQRGGYHLYGQDSDNSRKGGIFYPVFRIHNQWIRIRIKVFCWIRMLSGTGSWSRPIFLWQNFLEIYNRIFFLIKNHHICLLVTSTKGVVARALQTWNSLIFPVLENDFGLPGSGS
jgi:hypothetical protein